MTHAQPEQVGQHRNAHGFLTASLVPPDLVLAQAQARFQLPVQALDGPTLLVEAHDLARRQLGQIGHQDFGLFGAQVSPSFAQDHSDFPDMTQTQTRMKRPKGLAAVPRLFSEHSCALVIGVCSGCVYMPCMAYTRLSQVPDYAKLLPQTLLSA